MTSNIEKYKADIDRLISNAERLQLALEYACDTQGISARIKKLVPAEKYAETIKNIPSFHREYQGWYSEACAVVKQLIPDRLQDFTKLYEIPKGRKVVDHGNYVIEDALYGIIRRNWKEDIVADPSSAIPRFQQQVAIVKSLKTRFESSLFNIRQLVQADLLDSELDGARELAKNNFHRAAGAVAGVVLERHLRQVVDNHNLLISKKHPTIGDLNNILKDGGVLDMPQWRFIQHLADVRNVCDHSKGAEPTAEQIGDMIAGVEKITKTVF